MLFAMKRLSLCLILGLLISCSDSDPTLAQYGCLSVLLEAPKVVYNGEVADIDFTMTNECDEPSVKYRGAPIYGLYDGDEPLRPDYAIPVPDYLADINLAAGESYTSTLKLRVEANYAGDPLPVGSYRLEAWWTSTEWAGDGGLRNSTTIVISNR